MSETDVPCGLPAAEPGQQPWPGCPLGSTATDITETQPWNRHRELQEQQQQRCSHCAWRQRRVWQAGGRLCWTSAGPSGAAAMARIMSATFTQIVMVLGTLHLLQVNDQNMQVTKELVQQHEEQLRQEMALLREMEQSSQEEPKITLWSLVLTVCQSGWFWEAASMLFTVFTFYWQLRHGSSGSNSSAQGETPAAPRRKRRRRRRKKSMHATAECGEQLDQVSSPDLRLERNDMQNSEEEGMEEGMIEASATPSPQETLGQNCVQGIH
ncbi:uncharacterized protein LOC135279711 [Passer domesticus]|uniref:uncharacterized protein LOC135279711 n=1 Tax=Passer domesticus TaxID=48849 RepID=UPI0030FF1212